jgi:hypothetical protein
MVLKNKGGKPRNVELVSSAKEWCWPSHQKSVWNGGEQ